MRCTSGSPLALHYSCHTRSLPKKNLGVVQVKNDSMWMEFSVGSHWLKSFQQSLFKPPLFNRFSTEPILSRNSMPECLTMTCDISDGNSNLERPRPFSLVVCACIGALAKVQRLTFSTHWAVKSTLLYVSRMSLRSRRGICGFVSFVRLVP
jgi:hypothetical protein